MERTVELGTLITPAKTVRCGDGVYPVLSMTMRNGLVFQDEKIVRTGRRDNRKEKRKRFVCQ